MNQHTLVAINKKGKERFLCITISREGADKAKAEYEQSTVLRAGERVVIREGVQLG